MRYYRCKCGERTAWGSMPPYRCAKCAACGSDLAEAPDLHRDPIPHDFSDVSEVETDNGPQPITRCRFCHRTRAEVDARPADKPEELNAVQLQAIEEGVLRGSNWTPFYITKIKAAFAQAARAIVRPELGALAASLPLDWDHHPVDATEGWEMLCRAKARHDQLERELAAKQNELDSARTATAGWQALAQTPVSASGARSLEEACGNCIDVAGCLSNRWCDIEGHVVSTSGLFAALERLCQLKEMKVALETQSGEKLTLPGGDVLRADIQRYYDTNKEPAWAEARAALSASGG